MGSCRNPRVYCEKNASYKPPLDFAPAPNPIYDHASKQRTPRAASKVNFRRADPRRAGASFREAGRFISARARARTSRRTSVRRETEKIARGITGPKQLAGHFSFEYRHSPLSTCSIPCYRSRVRREMRRREVILDLDNTKSEPARRARACTQMRNG
jgi:hypothetical protein